jgi:glycosyltransferase involved in cell wall biosynthesis
VSVQILLSTFNGVPFLRQLMESLLAQDYAALRILVRDDGSTDGTVDLLRQFETAEPAMRFLAGAHVGFQKSFFELLRSADPAVDYVALCDQDDVWLPDKVSRAVTFLDTNPSAGPTLYCSRATVVDQDLNRTGESPIPARGLSFENALVECPPVGCTILLDREARRLVETTPNHAYSHDWWIYLAVSAFGRVFYDPEPKVLYRRHSGNVFQFDTQTTKRLQTRLMRFLTEGRDRPVFKQAAEFARIFGPRLSARHRAELGALLEAGRSGVPRRLRYALSCGVYRQSWFDNLTLRLLLLLNRL